VKVMVNPTVSVIVVNHNGKGVLRDSIQSVFSSKYRPLEVIVVDNGSTDGSDAEIKKEYDVMLLRNRRNLGFAYANNMGIRAAKGEYCLMLNSDAIVSPEAIGDLVNEASTSRGSGFYQPKILMLDKPGIVNSTGIDIHLAGFGLLRGAGQEDNGQYDQNKQIRAAHGACTFASKKALQDIGLFDGSFFGFNEDTDLGWRALLRGWRPRYVSSATVYHRWGHTWGLGSLFPRKLYYLERNRLIMVLTNYERQSLILLLPILLLAEVCTIAYCLSHSFLNAKIKTYADIIRMRRLIVRRRRLIQSYRREDDRCVINSFVSEFRHPFLANHAHAPLNSLFKLLRRVVGHES